MAFITRAQLANYQSGLSCANESVRARQATGSVSKSSEAEVTVFLSHSHKDRELIQPAIAFFRSQGVKIWVDWMDDGMPDKVSGETAKILKQKIQDQRKFVVLVSENSKDSRWVPWELGYADSRKGMDHIAALPVAQTSAGFQHNEYLEIYPRIEPYNENWIVWTADPAKLVYLENWLRS
jgi:hypothetical protein